MRLRSTLAAWVLGMVPLAGVLAGGDCAQTSMGFVPLPDLGPGLYNGSPGGLYPGGLNPTPSNHLAAGLALSAQIVPRDAAGNPNPTGRIGVLFLGMSNANQIFGTLIELMRDGLASNVVLVNGAQGGIDAGRWANPADPVWPTVVDPRIAAAGLTSNQIQLVCHYHGMAHSLYPPQPWPLTPQDFQFFCERIASNTVSRFPMARINLWSSREYGGYATTVNNPEPYAYQSGFAVKWMIEKQIADDPTVNYEPTNGPVRSAWMAWGPYTWSDGLLPRSDGLIYECRDFQADGTHPRFRGRVKVAAQWSAFLRASPLTAPWIRPPGNLPPMVKIVSPPDNVVLPVGGRVAVEVFAADDDGWVTQVHAFAATNWIGSVTHAPYSILWTNAPNGSNLLTAVAVDNLGAAATSLVVVGRFASATTSAAAVVSDAFESGDLVGGAGWNQPGWLTTGTVHVTNGLAPPEGAYQCQVFAGSQAARGFDAAIHTGLTLRFTWRGLLPTGHVFAVDALGTSFTNSLLVRTQTLTVVTNEAVSLAGYAATNVILRFRNTGPTMTASILLDQIAVEAPGAVASVRLGIAAAPPLVHASWTAEVGQTWSVLTSAALVDWDAVYHTTAEETGPIVWSPAAADRAFHATKRP